MKQRYTLPRRLGQLTRKSKFQEWKDVSPKEIEVFNASEIAMGIVRQPTLFEYFSKYFWFTVISGFANVFTRNRYELIH